VTFSFGRVFLISSSFLDVFKVSVLELEFIYSPIFFSISLYDTYYYKY
jgi:hypothetical protein